MTVPAHSLALRAPWPEAHQEPAALAIEAADPRATARTPSFLLLAVAFTLSGFAMYAVVFSLMPLLNARGAAPAAAAWALGLGGLGQTIGRTLFASFARRTTPPVRTVVLVAAGGLATALLAAVPGPLPLLVAIAVLAGTVRGNLTLLQATAVTDRWGTAAYGRLSGLLGAPATIAGALAPWAAAALAPPLGGYPQLFLLLAALSGLAALLAALPAGARPLPT